MFNGLRYTESPIPNFQSEEGQALAQHFFDKYRGWRDASSDLRNKIWPACNKGFLGIRSLPRSRGMVWVDKGTQGETDLWDAVRLMVDGILLSLMPRDMTWLQPVAVGRPEDQEMQNRIRDYLTYKVRQSDFRGNFGKHIEQLMVLGTSAYSLSWDKVEKAVLQGPAQAIFNQHQDMIQSVGSQLAEQIPMLGQISPDDPGTAGANMVQQLAMERAYEIAFEGPLLNVLNMYDVYLDPSCTNRGGFDIPKCVRFYKTLDELHNSVDENGQPLFSNLEGLNDQWLENIWSDQPNRTITEQSMGINPAGIPHYRAKYVPVLVFHAPVEVVKDQRWVDTYFYVALNTAEGLPRLIAARPNPSETGARSIFVDTNVEHFNGSPYGISAIEKSLPAWNQKNVVSALTLQAQVASVFPAYTVIAGMTTDDSKVTNAPGGYNFISYKPSLGVNFMAPVPVPASGSMLGMQAQQFLGQKILGQTGALGSSLGNDKARNITENKTATQIDTESTSMGIGRDNLLEKLTLHSLEPAIQAVYDMICQYAPGALVEYIIEQNGQQVLQTLNIEDLKKKRKIIVTGYHGMLNRQNEQRNIKEALGDLGQNNLVQYLGPGGPMMIQELALKMMGSLGIKDIDKYKQNPLAMLLNTPGGADAVMQILAQAFEMAGVPLPIGQHVIQSIMMQLAPGAAGAPPGGPGGPPQGAPPQGVPQ